VVADERRGTYLLAFGSMATLQGGNALAILLIRHLGVAASVSLRLAFGAVFLVAVLRPGLRLGRAEVHLVLRFGVVIAAMSGFIYEAVDRLPLSVAVTVSLLGPLTVAAVGSRRRLDLVWPLLALVGVVVLAGAGDGIGSSVDLTGLAFAAGNAVAWGSYIVVAARAGTHFDGVHGLALACAVAAAIWLPLGVASGGYAQLTVPVLLLAILTAIVATGLPYTLENLALRRMPKRVFGTLMSFEPAIATVVGLAFGQVPGPFALLGIGLVIVASIGASLPVAPSPVSAL
jgi:inner membrane transporter RhtA